MRIDWHWYNECRKAEGVRRNEWVSRIADKTRELLGLGEGVRDRLISAILATIVKLDNKISYWELVNHFQPARCTATRLTAWPSPGPEGRP